MIVGALPDWMSWLSSDAGMWVWCSLPAAGMCGVTASADPRIISCAPTMSCLVSMSLYSIGFLVALLWKALMFTL